MHPKTQEISEVRPYLLVDNPLVGTCVTEFNRIVFCNSRFSEILGFSSKELYGSDISGLFEYVRRRDRQHNLRNESKDVAPSVREVRGFTKGGLAVHTRQSIREFQHGATRSTLWQVTDITEHKAAQVCVRASKERLCLLSGQVLEAQETERKRVAAELHDGIGQSLSSVKLNLENTLRDLCEEIPEEALIKIMSAISSVRETIEEVRRVSMNLRPSMLDDLGIGPSISWLCREWQSAHPLTKVIKKIDLGQSDINSALSVTIFRILQEALNNIAKHAKASQVVVSLKICRNTIILCVRDNGRGFAVASTFEAREGYGLYSMKERAILSGGRMRIHSALGIGTRVKVNWSRHGAQDIDKRDLHLACASMHGRSRGAERLALTI